MIVITRQLGWASQPGGQKHNPVHVMPSRTGHPVASHCASLLCRLYN